MYEEEMDEKQSNENFLQTEWIDFIFISTNISI